MAESATPKKSSCFRWKYLVPAVVVIALVVVFNIFFLDMLVKRGLVAAGEMAFGAKVEIASLNLSLTRPAIRLQGLRVANKEQPMTNLFEVDALRGNLQPLPLLAKKVIIQDMSVEGVRWGTARKSSGALPPKKQKAIAKKQAGPMAKLAAKLKGRAEAEWQSLPAWDSIQKAKNQMQSLSVDKVVNPSELQTLKAVEPLKQEYQQKAGDYEKRLQGLDVQPKINSLKNTAQALQGIKVANPQDALAAKDKIAGAQKEIQSLQELNRTLQGLKQDAERDFSQAANLGQRFQELKDRDFKALMGKLELPTLSTGNLLRALVGSAWLNKIYRMVDLAGLARRYLPAKKDKAKKSVRTRMHGQDVSFPVANRPPGFHIIKMSLTGSTGGEGKTNEPLDFSGVITDITSEPALVGRPTKAEIKGRQGTRSLGIRVVLDHLAEVPKDSVAISLKGMKASGLQLPKSDYLPSFQQGLAAVDTAFMLSGDNLESSLNISFSRLGAPLPAPEQQAEVKRLLASLWKGVNGFTVRAKMAGTLENLQYSVESDLDKILSSRLQAMLGEELAAVQQKIRAEINRYTAEVEKKARAEAEARKKQVLGQVAGQQQAVQEQIASAQKIIQEKQDLVNRAADAEKKKAEEKAKQGAQDQLKKLFK
ncbi:TIGR03545 family protein [candidate division FCPU426 bacterium]|nr:TIGR03545 family protein [candidate division FCPU426 bacterium]